MFMHELMHFASIHRIHKAWSEFSAAWSRGILGQDKMPRLHAAENSLQAL